jgi:diaminohydroxyphosphoribosylaminopyrimidine deaminase / 5-amino-6-(5-phosphoribosylamino)uracil reductase
MIEADERWMRLALELAKLGEGSVEPNPMVGAVIVRDGQILGQGFHERFGQNHAERNALANLKGDLTRATLYVTLEPCCHHGKTPPCTDAILTSGIRRVVIGMEDPFPEVAGKGIQILEGAGIEVISGILRQEALDLNAPYLKRLKSKMPWVIAKWAMTLDGKIATNTGDSQWISNESSRNIVHELRGKVDAILVGAGTVRADDPLLTARSKKVRAATRIVLTNGGPLPESRQLLKTIEQAPVVLLCPEGTGHQYSSWKESGAEIIEIPRVNSQLEITSLLKILGERSMTNLLIEGGAGVLGSFFDADAIDEVMVFIAPKIIGGVNATSPIGGRGLEKMSAAIECKKMQMQEIEGDFYFRGRIKVP